MTVIIDKAGFMTTVQDAGRPGYAHIGVPASGFMDGRAAQLANRMVNNDDNTALLEVDIAGISLTMGVACTAAVAGAQAVVLVNQKTQDTARPINLKTNDQLVIKPLTGGMWAYLAFAGGIATDAVLGSYSTLVMANLGGYQGRRLEKQDGLSLHQPAVIAGRSKPCHKRLPHTTIHALAASPGPEFDLFTGQSQKLIFSESFAMTEHISRQGMKLTGPQLNVKSTTDIASSGLVPGSLQVTPGGEYIITHRDSQTTGGYPRIIVLQRQALHQLAQVRPGEKIYFYRG